MAFFRKVVQPAAASDVLPVLAEPKPGVTDAEVVAYLRSVGAAAVDVIAPGFISALARRAILHDIGKIAHVHVKTLKEPRTA